MKNVIKISVIIIHSFYCWKGAAQNNDSFIEETAFNYYKTQILQTSSIGGKLKISESLFNLNYVDAECLKNKVENNKNIIAKPSSKYCQGYRFDLKNDKKIFRKVKNINKLSNAEKFVEVSMASGFDNRTFVVIHESLEGQFKTYTFEFDSNGEIIDWCLSSKGFKLAFY